MLHGWYSYSNTIHLAHVQTTLVTAKTKQTPTVSSFKYIHNYELILELVRNTNGVCRMVNTNGVCRMVNTNGVCRMVNTNGICRMVNNNGVCRMVNTSLRVHPCSI